MLKAFICPDNYIINKTDCWQHCRLEHRCLTLPTLRLIGQERTWSGLASTTQLLNGTMYSYLVLTKDFAVNPDDRMFSVLGTNVHKSLEEQAKILGLPSEVALNVDRDIFDLLEPDEQGRLCMTDLKTWGSFKVAKALGIVVNGKKPDPSGELYRSSGKWGKAGTVKMVNNFVQDESKADNMEANLQLNRYRIMLAEKHQIHLHSMQLEVIVRDGGTYTATGRGITRNSYLIPVPELDDNFVAGFFDAKNFCLMQAMEHGWSNPCSEQECWDGKKCAEYCEVWNYCVKGIGIHSVMNKQEEVITTDG